MTTDADTLARLEAVLARLERLAPSPAELDAVTPFALNTVVPGELIESAWGNSVIERITRPTEYKSAAIAFAATGFTTTATVPGGGALTMGSRGFPRLLIASVNLNLAKSAGSDVNYDLYLGISTAMRRIRVPPGQSAEMFTAIPAPANVAVTVEVKIGATSAGITLATAGGADMNGVAAFAIPVYSLVAL